MMMMMTMMITLVPLNFLFIILPPKGWNQKGSKPNKQITPYHFLSLSVSTDDNSIITLNFHFVMKTELYIYIIWNQSVYRHKPQNSFNQINACGHISLHLFYRRVAKTNVINEEFLHVLFLRQMIDQKEIPFWWLESTDDETYCEYR